MTSPLGASVAVADAVAVVVAEGAAGSAVHAGNPSTASHASAIRVDTAPTLGCQTRGGHADGRGTAKHSAPFRTLVVVSPRPGRTSMTRTLLLRAILATPLLLAACGTPAPSGVLARPSATASNSPSVRPTASATPVETASPSAAVCDTTASGKG